jgi:hypothetical protein
MNRISGCERLAIANLDETGFLCGDGQLQILAIELGRPVSSVDQAEAVPPFARPDTLISLRDIHSPLRGIFATHAHQPQSPVFKPFFSRY